MVPEVFHSHDCDRETKAFVDRRWTLSATTKCIILRADHRPVCRSESKAAQPMDSQLPKYRSVRQRDSCGASCLTPLAPFVEAEVPVRFVCTHCRLNEISSSPGSHRLKARQRVTLSPCMYRSGFRQSSGHLTGAVRKSLAGIG